MKLFKRTFAILLALLLMASIPVAVLAEEYDIADGSVDIHANEEGQYVWQDGSDESVEDAAPVITGSSETNWITVFPEEGCEATVTLQDVTAAAMVTYGEGDATVTVEGSNTVDYVDLYNDTTKLEGSGSIDSSSFNVDATEVIVDGPDVTASGEWVGVVVYPYNSDTATLTVESGSVTGIASGAEFTPMDTVAAEGDAAEEADEPEETDLIFSAGILVDPNSSLVVNGGTVTGINENQDLPGKNPGIAFFEDSTLTVGEGVKVLNDEGEDITEAAVADPTVLNDYAEATITEEEEPPVIVIPTIVSSLKQTIESEIKDEEGNVVDGSVRVDFYENHVFRITVRTPNFFYVVGGKFDAKDGKLAFTLKNGTELEFTDDYVLTAPLPNGCTVSPKLDKEIVDTLLASF